MKSQRWLWSSVVLVSMVLVTLSAQTPKPTFEVASVKRNASGSFSRSIKPRPGGIFDATNTPMPAFIEFAYGFPEYKLVGGPQWVQTDRFDIAAKAGRDVPPTELRLMVQSLLEERFKLVVRQVPRQMSHFALVVARSDGRLGPDLKRVAGCETASIPDVTTTAIGKLVAGAGGAIGGRPCVPISVIADVASRALNIPVVDRTGLTGGWDYALRFGSESRQWGSTVTASAEPVASEQADFS